MSDLLTIFQNPKQEVKDDVKVSIEDYGNVEALKAGIRDPVKIKEYMEKLRRERDGLPEPEENKENQENSEN